LSPEATRVVVSGVCATLALGDIARDAPNATIKTTILRIID
jgi:hypothetical protein